jgi:shikimate kinase
MDNIILVGFMGTGKTSAGKLLAEKLGREFLELDGIIEKKEGLLIKDIFAKKGESYFRGLEKNAVKEAVQNKGAVISAGGGAVIDEENLKNFKENGVLICLEASPAVILKRTKGSECRPLLNVPDPEKKIRELLQRRKPYYQKADFCVDTDEMSVEEVVEKIMAVL